MQNYDLHFDYRTAKIKTVISCVLINFVCSFSLRLHVLLFYCSYILLVNIFFHNFHSSFGLVEIIKKYLLVKINR